MHAGLDKTSMQLLHLGFLKLLHCDSLFLSLTIIYMEQGPTAGPRSRKSENLCQDLEIHKLVHQ